jgi:hypothetical protein
MKFTIHLDRKLLFLICITTYITYAFKIMKESNNNVKVFESSLISNLRETTTNSTASNNDASSNLIKAPVPVPLKELDSSNHLSVVVNPIAREKELQYPLGGIMLNDGPKIPNIETEPRKVDTSKLEPHPPMQQKINIVKKRKLKLSEKES